MVTIIVVNEVKKLIIVSIISEKLIDYFVIGVENFTKIERVNNFVKGLLMNKVIMNNDYVVIKKIDILLINLIIDYHLIKTVIINN